MPGIWPVSAQNRGRALQPGACQYKSVSAHCRQLHQALHVLTEWCCPDGQRRQVLCWTLQAYLEQGNDSPLQLYLIPCWSPGDYHLCHFNLLYLKTHSETWSFPHPTAFSKSLVITMLLIPQHRHEISDSWHSPPSAWSSCSDSSQADHDVGKERVRLFHK